MTHKYNTYYEQQIREAEIRNGITFKEDARIEKYLDDRQMTYLKTNDKETPHKEKSGTGKKIQPQINRYWYSW